MKIIIFFRFLALSLLFLWFSEKKTVAQEKGCGMPFSIEAKTHYGFIMAHRPGVKNLVKGHVPALEISFDRPTFGDRSWQQLYNFPSWGVSFYFADLANPEELGYASGIYPYFGFALINKKKIDLYYRIGWGLGHMSKSFHPENNYKNIFISSRMNAIISSSANLNLRVNQRMQYHLGISYTHFSNGAYKIPNLGMNIPAVNTGFSYRLGGLDKVCRRDSLITVPGKHEVFLLGGGFLKEIYPAGGNKFPAFSLGVNVSRTISQKSKLIAALDVFYNSSHFNRHPYDTLDITNKMIILQYGIGLFYELRISKMAILFGKGIYIHSRMKSDGLFYHRIGTRYYVNDRLFLNLTLKSHFARADHAEFGLGYRFLSN